MKKLFYVLSFLSLLSLSSIQAGQITFFNATGKNIDVIYTLCESGSCSTPAIFMGATQPAFGLANTPSQVVTSIKAFMSDKTEQFLTAGQTAVKIKPPTLRVIASGIFTPRIDYSKDQIGLIFDSKPVSRGHGLQLVLEQVDFAEGMQRAQEKIAKINK